MNIDPVALPPHAQLTTLDCVDYTDAFRLETELAQERTAEGWARALLEEAPEATRVMLRRRWFALGVQLGSTEDDRLVLGWPVRRGSPDHVLLGARSRLGIEAEVLVGRERSAVVVATFMQLKNPAARAVWTGFAPKHRRVLHHLLDRLESEPAASTAKRLASPAMRESERTRSAASVLPNWTRRERLRCRLGGPASARGE